jgi:hypothetical protein
VLLDILPLEGGQMELGLGERGTLLVDGQVVLPQVLLGHLDNTRIHRRAARGIREDGSLQPFRQHLDIHLIQPH